MIFFLKTLTVNTQKPFDFVPIDKEIGRVVAESQIKNGFILLRSAHTTAALTCIENDQDVLHDLESVLKKLLPDDFSWTHTMEGINNARAHQAVSLLGQAHWVPIENSQLKMGAWQSIFLIEFYQGRTRKVEIIIIGE